MANTVYNVEEVMLQDGTAVTLRPLNIKTLRVFMKHMEGLPEVKDEDDYLGLILKGAVICLKKQKPEIAEQDEDGSYPVAEELLDLDTIFKVLEVCGGTKLNDPKTIEAAMELMEQAQGGTN